MEKRVDRNKKIYEEIEKRKDQKKKEVSNEDYKHTHSILEKVDETYFKEDGSSTNLQNNNDEQTSKNILSKKQFIITAIIFAVMILLIIGIAVVISL